MNKRHLIVVVAVLTLLSASVIVYAQSVSKQDSYIVVTEPSTTTHGTATTFWVQDSTTSCNEARVGYLQADLTPYSAAQIESATLVLTSGGGPVTAGGATLTLYGVNDISGGVTGVNTGNDIDVPIASASGTEVVENVPAPSAAGQTVTFGAAYPNNSSALVTYLKSQAGGIATFALSLSAGCGNTSTTAVFASLENATVANRPSLTLWNPTAVSIDAFSAQTQSGNLFVWLALAVPLLVVGALLIFRRGSQQA